MTDVSNAIFDGSSAIMLSDETSIGNYPVESLRYMKNITLETEKNMNLTELSCSLKELGKIDISKPENYAKIINYSSCITANLLNAAGILCITKNEKCAIALSNNRTKAPIFAVTTSEQIAKQLSLVWNVHPILIEGINDTNQLIQKSIEKLKVLNYLKEGDSIVINGDTVEDKDSEIASLVSSVMKI